MKNKLFKQILWVSGGLFVILGTVLYVHIYQVTHRKITDPNAVAMARMDFGQDFTQQDATNYTLWFVKQKGVQNVVFNPQYRNAVFTFYPVRVNATDLVNSFCHNFSVNAKRFVPSKAEMMKGCPVATN